MKSLSARAIRSGFAKVFSTPDRRRHDLVGPGAVWKQKRDFQISFLKAQGLLPEHTLLDVGCGTLRGGIPLIHYLDRGNYVGFDVRQSVIDEAHQELDKYHSEAKAPVLLVVAHLGDLRLDRSFDVLWAFSVLIHLEDKILDEALALATTHLQPDGRFFANVNIGQRQSGSWREFPITWRPMSFYQERGRAHGMSVEDLGTLGSLGHTFGHGDHQHMLRFAKIPS